MGFKGAFQDLEGLKIVSGDFRGVSESLVSQQQNVTGNRMSSTFGAEIHILRTQFLL